MIKMISKKKIFAVLLSLVMIISATGITAAFAPSGFASANLSGDVAKSISVSFVIEGENEPQEYSSIMSIGELNSASDNVDSNTVKGARANTTATRDAVDEITAFDAVTYAIADNFGSDYSWDLDNSPSMGEPGAYFTSINGYEAVNNYYEYINEYDGLWYGNSSGTGWTVTIDGEIPDTYLNHIPVDAIQDIALTYSPYEYDWVLDTQPVNSVETSPSEDCNTSEELNIIPINGSLNSYEAGVSAEELLDVQAANKASVSLKLLSKTLAKKNAQAYGYSGAEALKEAYVGRSAISEFNMYYNSTTHEIVLVKIKDSAIQIFTKLYMIIFS